jgi:transposase InsO family protein
MKEIHPTALFRLTVLGSLISREVLVRGELNRELQRLSEMTYDIPGSSSTQLSPKTIENWYYLYRNGGIEALEPKVRSDQGQSKLRPELQEAVIAAKKANRKRSIRTLKRLMEEEGLAAKGELSRSSIHRLLKSHGLTDRSDDEEPQEEFRRFEAACAGDIWYGDVMHGPRIMVDGRLRKTYLATLMDDASRLVAHSVFCLAESALEIEGALKQALLKRGLPRKLVIDNGAAYRAASLQGICARLAIPLVYCRPYAPQGKAKLERWHRTVRGQFLSEIDARMLSLDELNARLWAWVERWYHKNEHDGLEGKTPLQRYQQDLPRIRPLGDYASRIDEIFLHRESRKVRKDGTVSYGGSLFEVPYELSGRTIWLKVDPHRQTIVGLEDKQGEPLGRAVPLDARANLNRKRHKPGGGPASPDTPTTGPSPVDAAMREHYGNPAS